MFKKIFYLLLFVFLGICFGLISFIIFDIYKNNDFNTNIENFYLNKNKILVYSIKEGKNSWFYGTDIVINKQGFRDVDFEYKKGNIKIMCLGDSTTFGGCVNTTSLYTNKLSELLDYKYSVFNLGVDGYNTIQEAENLRINGIKYSPNIVLVTFCLNDFAQTCDPMIYYATKANFCKLNIFFCKSKFYRRYIFLPVLKLIETLKKENRINVVEMYRKYGTIDVSNITDEEIGIKIISDLQNEYNFKCYFFILPFFRNFDNYLQEDENKSIHLKEILQKYPNIKYFDLKDDFINISKDSSIFINEYDEGPDFIHPNNYGNELLAQFIYKKLKEDGVLNE